MDLTGGSVLGFAQNCAFAAFAGSAACSVSAFAYCSSCVVIAGESGLELASADCWQTQVVGVAGEFFAHARVPSASCQPFVRCSLARQPDLLADDEEHLVAAVICGPCCQPGSIGAFVEFAMH